MFYLLLLIMIASSLLFLIAASLVIVVVFRSHFSPNRRRTVRIPAGNMKVPNTRSLKWRTDGPQTELIMEHFASLPLPSWRKEGKVMAPRIALAKLRLGREVGEVNDYLMKQDPWGAPGTSWPLRPGGDYDFTMTVLASILHLFGKDEAKLHPETALHIARDLIGTAGVRDPRKVPGSFGIFMETENHVLMIQSSRYLAARWLMKKGEGADKELISGLERSVLTLLHDLENPGPYEFNSDPYIGYTMTALLNLEAFGSRSVRYTARRVLDRLNYGYALSQFRLRRLPPFRRQSGRASKGSLLGGNHTPMVSAWLSKLQEPPGWSAVERGFEHALMASVLPYRLPDRIVELLLHRKEEYYVRIGHGSGSCPEVYSGGPGYLISGGGASRGPFSRIGVRPITIILDDGSSDLKEVIRLSGPTGDRGKWNNTGVHRKFAVAAGPVKIPMGWKPAAQDGLWKVYGRGGLSIGVHSDENLGIVCLLDETPEGLQYTLKHLNGDRGKLYHTFDFPGGSKLQYDVLSPRSQWVMTGIDGIEQERSFDKWPLLEGSFLKRRRSK
ncbi:MAG: hypothetical protein ACMUIE_09740 [Thermoplasmatota archaeon]